MKLAYSNGLALPLFTAVDIQSRRVTLAVYETAEEHQRHGSPDDIVQIPDVLPVFAIGSSVCRHPVTDDVLYLVDTLSIDIDRISELLNPRSLGPCASLYLTFDAAQRKLLPPYNKMAESYPTKDHGSHHIEKIQRNVIAQILLPFTDHADEDFAFRFSVNESLGYWSSQDAERIENSQDTYLDFARRLFPKLRVDHQVLQLASDERRQITVQLTGPDDVVIARPDVRVYAKCDAGYLARREAVTDANGQVHFPYAALGLAAGDEATVEVGFKWYSNIARCHVRVST